MSGKKILLVEDNEQINIANKRMLILKGYSVDTAANLKAARVRLKTRKPDLVVLDIMLPDGSGLEFCKEIRRSMPDIPVLFLTALGENNDIVAGLRNGGDDYLSKPYSYEVLLARIEALLRRARANSQPIQSIGPFVFEQMSLRVYRNGHDTLLTPKEFALFCLFVDNLGNFMQPESIFERLWGSTSYGNIHTVYSHISSLRKKLELNDDSELILEQRRGRGYRLIFQNEIEI